MSSTFRIGLQKSKGGHRVVLVSENNGKLVLAGETINDKDEAWASLSAVHEAWCDKRNALWTDISIYPAGHKWPKNSGPKKKAVKKAATKKK
jgi:hypothetical protein